MANSAFTSMELSLALERSMKYNSRRLEAIGYAFSVSFFQYLIAGYEDIFLICPQFPIYVSLLADSADPDTTLPDAGAKGVYVDLALLMVRASQRVGGALPAALVPTLSEAFARANNSRKLGVYMTLDINALEVPILEEKKRCPTRHPKDIEAYVTKLHGVLKTARLQVRGQAKVLFASPRFDGQRLAILIASSGEYYRLAVVQRDHPCFTKAPDTVEVVQLSDNHREDFFDVGGGDTDDTDLCTRLVEGVTPTEQAENRAEALRKAAEAVTERQKKERAERVEARKTKKEYLNQLKLQGRYDEKTQLIFDGGSGVTYPDPSIENFYTFLLKIGSFNVDDWTEHPKFFEPEPPADATLMTFAELRNPNDERAIVFTGVIIMGSSTSEKFINLIRPHLQQITDVERLRRNHDS